ncbi:hypothetical protein C8R44DRAFT_867157 [Mycena epipterygia]|nr:hypothetical protein C8R44DRAFT_867157 [Mycena epipterygia]
MYALNTNGLVGTVKLHHINNAINGRSPHAFVLTESKTNTRTGPNLLNGDYTIFKEPGLQADQHHLFKWGLAVGVRKNIQVAQRIQVTSAALRGHVIAINVVLQTNNGEDFYHRIIGAYAPWDPGLATTSDFWPELTKLCLATPSSWTLGGNLNATVSAHERASGGAEARAQFLAFLANARRHDLWSNNPNRNCDYDWTSRASIELTSGNIIDHIVTSNCSYIDGEISAADRSQDFVPGTNHRVVVAQIVYTPPSGSGSTIFPAFNAELNKARIKYPTRMEKHRHEDFRNEIERKLNESDIKQVQVSNDESFLAVYDSFTGILLPAVDKSYSCIARYLPNPNARIMTSKIEKTVARLRFLGGVICTLRYENAPNMSHGATLEYNRLAHSFPSQGSDNQLFLDYVLLERQKLNHQLYRERVEEIRDWKNKQDRYQIMTALNNGSTKRLVSPGEFIQLPITVNDLHSEKLLSSPDAVKETSREYWSNLYHHNPPPNIPKPWLMTKSVLVVKQRVQAEPFQWPRQTSLAEFQVLLRKGMPHPALGRDKWEKWLIKSLPDRALEVVLKLHNYIIMTSRFPGDLKDMWLTMFHKHGLRTDLSNWRGLLLSNFLANSPMSWLNYNLVPYIAKTRILRLQRSKASKQET